MSDELKMLAPQGFREKLSRRAFLQGGTAVSGFALIAAACGGSDAGPESASDSSAPTGDTAGLASGDWSRVINQSSGTLAMYTWGDYNDPDLVGALAGSTLSVTMKVDYYASNEDLITKLAASAGSPKTLQAWLTALSANDKSADCKPIASG